MRKALMLASVASMIDKFNMDNIFLLQKMGFEVDVVANFDFGSITSQERVDEFQKELQKYLVNVYNIHIPRSIANIKKIFNSYEQIKKLCDSKCYEIIHCHSPIGGVLTRLASRKTRKNGTKVIYTAHGFHFFKGAPLINWLLYFPIEWICSFLTDTIITINKEDYNFAKKYLHSKKVRYIPGIGVDTEKFNNTHKYDILKRREIDVPDDAIMLLSVGELSKRKNHEIIIKAISKLNNPRIIYCIAGIGDKKSYLSELASQLNLSTQIKFLGFRSDIKELCNASDIFCFSSLQEGLPVALMEAMSAGLPCIVSRIRGNTDLIDDKKGGFLCNPTDVNGFATCIESLVDDISCRKSMGKYNLEKIKSFDLTVVNKEMEKIYAE